MRLLALLFPDLAVELARRGRPGTRGRALILVAGRGDEACVAAASAEARARGVQVGLSAARALATCPEALAVADNSSACLDALDRLAAILRRRTTTRVAVAGRDHLLLDLDGLPGDETALAARLPGPARAWSGCEVRAAVADSPAEALHAARCARQQPVILPAADHPTGPLPCFSRGPLRASVTLAHGTPAFAAGGRLRSLAVHLDALLAARDESVREVVVALEGAEPGEARLRLPQPAHAVAPLLDALLAALPPVALAHADRITLDLLRPGPAVLVQPRSALATCPPLARAS
ncbi:MAG: hypothetical protein IT304_11210 [Dehalococcoidia bacterium]|nr:hypothetical protein [Dehalococcoidia bacterium]